MDWLHGEPALEDALSDPVIRAVMARDGVEREALQRLLRDIGLVRHRMPWRQPGAPVPGYRRRWANAANLEQPA